MSAGQAEALSDALGDNVLDSVATKSDLKELELRLRAEIKELELRLMVRVGAMLAASTAITVSIIGALITLS